MSITRADYIFSSSYFLPTDLIFHHHVIQKKGNHLSRIRHNGKLHNPKNMGARSASLGPTSRSKLTYITTPMKKRASP